MLVQLFSLQFHFIHYCTYLIKEVDLNSSSLHSDIEQCDQTVSDTVFSPMVHQDTPYNHGPIHAWDPCCKGQVVYILVVYCINDIMLNVNAKELRLHELH